MASSKPEAETCVVEPGWMVVVEHGEAWVQFDHELMDRGGVDYCQMAELIAFLSEGVKGLQAELAVPDDA